MEKEATSILLDKNEMFKLKKIAKFTNKSTSSLLEKQLVNMLPKNS